MPIPGWKRQRTGSAIWSNKTQGKTWPFQHTHPFRIADEEVAYGYAGKRGSHQSAVGIDEREGRISADHGGQTIGVVSPVAIQIEIILKGEGVGGGFVGYINW